MGRSIGLAVGMVVLTAACSGGGSGGTTSTGSGTGSSSSSSSGSVVGALIKVNQLGYRPNAEKIAIVPDSGATTFSVVNVADNALAFQGNLTEAAMWEPSQDTVRQADFSSLTTPGEYKIRVDNTTDSYTFVIGDDVYEDVHDAALKAYYFNRASTALEATYAGAWSRPAGHPDTNVQVHSSAATATRQTGTVISAPKGWYDAGDFNKYVVNSGISTYTLLAAYEHFTSFYQNRDGNIPESNNAVPDILDEIMWNLEWLEQMQDEDGGVYHKLTTQNFSGTVMPHQATAQRFVVQKGTAATLNFAAVMAYASRIYSTFNTQFPGKADAYRQAAINAWEWAQDNNNVAYSQPPDIQTGVYGDGNFADEFSWAAAELYLLTGQPQYLQSFNNQNQSPGTILFWGNVVTLGYMSLAENGEGLLMPSELSAIENALISVADTFLDRQDASAFKVSVRTQDFDWGSNSKFLNHAIIMLQAYRITDDEKYKNAAQGMLDYALGKNATDYSFVTGFGDRTPMDPHHRQSAADNVNEPIPGFLVGGPHTIVQDGERNCNYPSGVVAKRYLDHYCSFSTNEVTINWNAPLIYVLAALQSD